jgi:hypothetical protein
LIHVGFWTKLRDFGPQENYTDRATAACRRSLCQLFRISFKFQRTTRRYISEGRSILFWFILFTEHNEVKQIK